MIPQQELLAPIPNSSSTLKLCSLLTRNKEGNGELLADNRLAFADLGMTYVIEGVSTAPSSNCDIL